MSLDQPFLLCKIWHLCYREQIYLSQDSIDKVCVPKIIKYPTITTLEAAALVVLFSEMLKFFPQKNFKKQKFVKDNIESSRMFYLSK